MITGWHCNRHVYDDLINPQRINADIGGQFQNALQFANNWVWGTAETRIGDLATCQRLVVSQRLHEDDPVGQAKRKGWEECAIDIYYYPENRKVFGPRTWKSDDRTKPGENAWPRRYPEAELSRIKSLTTVNTSPILQAVAGGVLEAHAGSLDELIEPKRAFYRANRDAMLSALESSFRGAGLGPEKVSWNRPAGGFFLTVDMPFDFGQELVERCAEHYGVICCPMSFFSLAPGRERKIRLSFSYVSPAEIAEGVERLARFVAEHDSFRAAGPGD